REGCHPHASPTGAPSEAAWRGPSPAYLVCAGLCDLAVGVPHCLLGPGQSQHPGQGLRRHQTGCWGQQQAPLALLQGIQFLIENDLLKNTCEDIAQFLYKGEGLNKTAIGDYLGERDEFNIQVLHAFVELHEFTDLNLVQALR
uniref:SEC7 domain-containing protein n=1 Tax=Buteo japonicus TaxID=224669 RepID=A0A8C0B9W5_9AVES